MLRLIGFCTVVSFVARHSYKTGKWVANRANNKQKNTKAE